LAETKLIEERSSFINNQILEYFCLAVTRLFVAMLYIINQETSGGAGVAAGRLAGGSRTWLGLVTSMPRNAGGEAGAGCLASMRIKS